MKFLMKKVGEASGFGVIAMWGRENGAEGLFRRLSVESEKLKVVK